MRYTGKWVFHSIGIVNDSDEMVYLSAEEYLHRCRMSMNRTKKQSQMR